ncbi:hypothetical protein K443DRAFT_210104 [Laccaria amethystina LaAM-08-1]|uniref:Uncharacterized protein n=1 Tax=Laccaria amethystina LaAM-08-1 TaxID=1095629 RepID=A0A0C9XQX4_9AGAR|nr:hypothetical protein K443DRAFT_210104 [Laccaria amethystina LaAM-08-1]
MHQLRRRVSRLFYRRPSMKKPPHKPEFEASSIVTANSNYTTWGGDTTSFRTSFHHNRNQLFTKWSLSSYHGKSKNPTKNQYNTRYTRGGYLGYRKKKKKVHPGEMHHG